MAVTIQFQQPDFNAARNPRAASAYDEGVLIEAEGFDLDFATLTIYDEDRDLNFTVAERAPYMNEDGVECGDIGWKINPEPYALEVCPELRPAIGKYYGRVIVFAVER